MDLDNDAAYVQGIIRDVLASDPEPSDGLEFELSSLRARMIRDEDEYPGVRVSATASLASARVNFHIDVNVGDPIWPGPQIIRVPRLRGGADIELRGYPLHMVCAEKIVTAIQRGVLNTRWRDYGDM